MLLRIENDEKRGRNVWEGEGVGFRKGSRV
jgi:hypothetical protein